VRDNDQDRLVVCMKIEKELRNGGCRRAIQVPRRFVAQQDGRFANERARHRRTLFLSA